MEKSNLLFITGLTGSGKTRMLEDYLKTVTKNRVYIILKSKQDSSLKTATSSELKKNGFEVRTIDMPARKSSLKDMPDTELYKLLDEELDYSAANKKSILFIDFDERLVYRENAINDMLKYLVENKKDTTSRITIVNDDVQSPIITDFASIVNASKKKNVNYVLTFMNFEQIDLTYGEELNKIELVPQYLILQQNKQNILNEFM